MDNFQKLDKRRFLDNKFRLLLKADKLFTPGFTEHGTF